MGRTEDEEDPGHGHLGRALALVGSTTGADRAGALTLDGSASPARTAAAFGISGFRAQPCLAIGGDGTEAPRRCRRTVRFLVSDWRAEEGGPSMVNVVGFTLKMSGRSEQVDAAIAAHHQTMTHLAATTATDQSDQLATAA